MSEARRTVRKTRLCDQGCENDLVSTTPEERIAMMWQLALDAWAMLGDTNQGAGGESRLQRHVVRVVRGKRSDPTSIEPVYRRFFQ